MNKENFELSCTFPVSADRLYHAWLSSDEHTAFTGGEASIENLADSNFTAWDGYIDGKILELDPGKRILQTWRTTDFPFKAEYSVLELVFEEIEGGCRLNLYHENIPEGQGKDYEKGWVEHYFKPMTEYFESFGKYIV
jgi:activator of HSP90 ATPase